MKKNFLQSALFIILLTIVFHLSGCTLSEQSNEMEHNWRLWQKNNIANYSFIGSSRCGAVIIKVQDSKAISIEQAFKSQVGINLDCYEKFDTVDKIFGYVLLWTEGSPAPADNFAWDSTTQDIVVGDLFFEN